MGRCAHASTTITGNSTSPTLVVIGGVNIRDQLLVNECLLLDTNQYSWKKVFIIYIISVWTLVESFLICPEIITAT